MSFTKEAQFEKALIEILFKKGWENKVIKNPTEDDISYFIGRLQQVKDEISKNQRDYFLREQVRAINKELGEQDERTEEVAEYKKKINKDKKKLYRGVNQGNQG